MSVKLVVFRPKAGKISTADEWLEGFEAYLRRKGWDGDLVEYQDSESFSNAPWIGSPFVLIDRPEEVTRHLKRLPAEASTTLSDCAYYWILSGGSDSALDDQFRHYSRERPIVLDWSQKNFEVITSRLELLAKYPRLAGLSHRLHKVRTDISRVAVGKKGPWSSVLILGESGTGKEEVAHSLYESLNFNLHRNGENKKKPANITALSCGTFSVDMLPSQLFGIGPNIATEVHGRDGLLKLGSDGCVFLDDFDTALKLIQGPLLRVMATSEDEPAAFYRVGEENQQGKEQKTWVWLMFSTNADIVTLMRQGELREDFIFRFKDRIIHIPPLSKRPADIPAIALRIWDSLWKGKENRKRPLTSPVLQHLLLRNTEWKGNVRALQTALSLMASMASLPAHNHHSLGQIIDEIMPPGSDFYDWVGIVLKDSFSGPMMLRNTGVQDILKLDEGINCLGSSKDKVTQTGSEKEAQARLSELGRRKFGHVLKILSRKREKSNLIRPRVRLARIIAYVARHNRIDRHIVGDLCQVKDAQASIDLKLLQEAKILQLEETVKPLTKSHLGGESSMREENVQATKGSQAGKKTVSDLLVFVKVAEMFQN
jgi:DNA-binding NtrC family response regulator